MKPFPWYSGKEWLVSFLASRLPPHVTYKDEVIPVNEAFSYPYKASDASCV